MHRLVLAIALSVLVWLLPVGPARASGPARPPVVEADLPDPNLVTDGQLWYLFATNTRAAGSLYNVPVLWSTSTTSFSSIADALPQLGAWAQPGFTWAPSVTHIGSTWVLYYTANQRASSRQCIGRATATAPWGPYHDTSATPLVCQLDRGGSIDGSSYVAPDGGRWLTWKSDDNTVGGTPWIWSARLTADGLNLAGAATPLLTAEASWEGGIVEAPTFVVGAHVLYLFYSGGWFDSADYAEGYATCAGPAGPCTKATTNAPWMDTARSGAVGSGGASMVSFGDYALMAFHSWRYAVGIENGGYRSPAIEPVSFAGGPDWQPSWFRGEPAWRTAASPGGTYVLDRYGSIHAFGGAPAGGATTWPGWPIARALALEPGGNGGFTLDGVGGLHPFATSTVGGPPIGGGAPYWPGWDIARDVVALSWSPVSGYVLDGVGGIHEFGGAPPTTGSAYWPGWDIARRLVLQPSSGTGYVLDGYGGLHPVGGAPTAYGSAYWFGWDIARSAALNPDGSGGYVLDGFGGLHPFAAVGGHAPPDVNVSYYEPGGAAVDVVVTDWAKPAGYVLDGFGGLHPFGAAGAPAVPAAALAASQAAPAAAPAPAPSTSEVLRGCRVASGQVVCTYATPYGGIVER